MTASPFVGPMCSACSQRKLRLLPHAAGWIWCFGCGSRRETSPAGLTAVEAGAKATCTALRDLRLAQVRL